MGQTFSTREHFQECRKKRKLNINLKITLKILTVCTFKKFIKYQEAIVSVMSDEVERKKEFISFHAKFKTCRIDLNLAH